MSEGDRTSASPGRWQFLALVAAAILPYSHTFNYGFINYDDNSAIANLPLIRNLSWRSLPGFFVPDIYDGLLEYMPLKNLSYAVDYALLGASPTAFRPQQMLWYVASVIAVYLWLHLLVVRLTDLKRLDLSRRTAGWMAFGVALLFALHPAHVESVTWLSGRKDVLSGAFMSAALYCGLAFSLQAQVDAPAIRARTYLLCAACLAFVALGLLSKPAAVMTAALLATQEFFIAPADSPSREQRRARWLGRVWLHGPAWLITLGFAAFYARVVAPYPQEPVRAATDPSPNAVVRIGEQLARDLQLTLDPSSLTPIVPDHALSADPTSPIAIAGYATLLALAVVLALGMRRRHPLALAVLLFVVPLLPSLIKPVWGQFVAGRYLYHAVLGPIFALSWLCAHTLERHARLRVLLAVAASGLALVWGGVTVGYNTAFRSSDALWVYSIEVDPKFPRFYDLGARAALLRGDPQRAVELLEQCIQAVPDASECAAPLGGLLLAFDPARGEALLEQVLPHDRTGTAHVRLAQYWSQRGRTREGLLLFERWLNGRAADPEQLGLLVDLALADRQLSRAKQYLRQQISVASVLRPASPPPAAEIVRTAERTGDESLATKARAAAERCNRNDCFAAVFGVRP